ncbi:uncharacterized protein L203_103824 [Cryptococcus depauperatus CBS 7841]|uniref:Uncharacterized protein n=1 Tax=Cryptococcus depauperatus CBS 7841 TaxID=1295531 RepID=A0A1E3IE47_9TREE|nr:hypothetical protein L203_03675 [Cryptococcus depauperatus CBS 7841]
MSTRQDKVTTDRNARILRDLVKQPENKACADCKRNDARWASWNLGVFLCIRCSGIHRSMGTHISKVKSIDLDMWTPEQMESIQKWGNALGNLYWEKHLKAGHIPPDHKIESFIRSKYESRRWAMDIPLPSDPQTLLSQSSASAPPPAAPQPTPTSTAPPPVPAHLPKTHPLLSRSVAASKAAPAAKSTAAPPVNLFGQESSSTAAPVPTLASAPAPTETAQSAHPQSSIFDLDFRPPSASASAPTSAPASAGNKKANIMSLFSNPPPSAPNPYATWNGGITSSAMPTQMQATQAPVAGSSNIWSGVHADQNAWGTPAQAAQAQVQSNIAPSPWSQPASNTLSGNGFDSSSDNPWAPGGGFFVAQERVQKEKQKVERDPFANIRS